MSLSPPAPRRPPLDGVKVLDLSRVLAGPWAAQGLADLGAEVWKVEEPARGDDTRAWLQPDLGGESTYFLCANRSKRSIALDLKSEGGRCVARELARRADVLVENYRRGALERLGLGYEALRALNPGLVYCSISGFGRTGPRADEAGYDFAIQAECGLMAITGEPSGAPMKVGVAVVDVATGLYATSAILAALLARARDGEGQLIDLALLDCGVALLANVASGHLATGRDPARQGNAHASIVPYQAFATADGTLALAVGNDGQFRALCERVIARPDLPADPRFATNPARVRHREALVALLAEAFAAAPAATWMERLEAAGVPAGRVRSVAEVFGSEDVRARGLVAEVPDAVHGTIPIPASPLALRGTPPRPPTAPPRLGEHTAAILREVLGLDEAEVAALRAEGAVR